MTGQNEVYQYSDDTAVFQNRTPNGPQNKIVHG